MVLNPRLILEANTPSGGDMAAHVAVPAYLRDVLLPEGRILGWSMDWFAGYPVFYFYFPLPSLVIVLLDVVLPYGVAFKIATVLGLLATPPAVYYLARSLRFGRPVATVAAGAGAAFIFMESFTIYGGNVLSTLAGEFSFSWSLALSLLYLGLLIRAVLDDPKYQVPAAVGVGGRGPVPHHHDHRHRHGQPDRPHLERGVAAGAADLAGRSRHQRVLGAAALGETRVQLRHGLGSAPQLGSVVPARDLAASDPGHRRGRLDMADGPRGRCRY